MSALWSGTPPRSRLGLALIVVGLLMILWGVFHVLDAVGSPAQQDFAHRRTYVQVKQAVHGAFIGALLRALPGLALMLLGSHLRKPSSSPP